MDHLCYQAKTGAAPIRLQFYPTARSPEYAYDGPPSVKIYDTGTGAVAAEFDVPPRVRKLLVILTSESNPRPGAGHYRVQVLDDSVKRGASGVRRILNLSGLELFGTMDRQSVVLQHGVNELPCEHQAVVVSLRTPYQGRTYQSFAETLPVDNSGRAWLILYPPYRPGSLEVQFRYLLDSPSSATQLKGR